MSKTITLRLMEAEAWALKALADNSAEKFFLVVGGIKTTTVSAGKRKTPRYSQKKGKTPVLDREEARALIESIDISTPVGLRDRALIATMVYTFARIGAVLQQNVRDYFTQGRRGWMRPHEKRGKELEAPRHHKLEIYMDEYIAI